jgi:hypothetical protein
MKKLDLDELVVSSFEVETPYAQEYAITNPTPDTRCFVCGPTDNSCDSFCPDQQDGGSL